MSKKCVCGAEMRPDKFGLQELVCPRCGRKKSMAPRLTDEEVGHLIKQLSLALDCINAVEDANNRGVTDDGVSQAIDAFHSQMDADFIHQTMFVYLKYYLEE